MLQTRTDPDVQAPPRTRERSAYREAELGFRNYWYPIFSSHEIKTNPRRFTICGDNIVLMRRNGKAYAIAEGCPHRGTSLALYPEKTYPFRGSNTITCPYHGWTFDVTDGKCVANVCEGPDSRLPGMVGIKTYPIQERKGIVWIWMGDMEPVPLEQDWPKYIFREDISVKLLNRVKAGNWRWHAENGPDGHAPMVHQNSPLKWFNPTGVQNHLGTPITFESDGVIGVRTKLANHDWNPYPDFPGLGKWPVRALWRRLLFSWWVTPQEVRQRRRKRVPGAVSGGICLPSYFAGSVGNEPEEGFNGYFSFEAYVPLDEDHYEYVQFTSFLKKNPVQVLLRQLRYYFWTKPIAQVMFNNGDSKLIPETTQFQKRNGWVDIARPSWNDDLLAEWRQCCDENARGVGTKYQ